MKCIFEASSGLEAQMIADLLHREEITTRTDGEYLQGGVGDLQAMNIVRVLVNDEDGSKAQKIIDAWHATQIDKIPTPINKSSGIGLGLFFGLFIGAGSVFWAYNSPITYDGIDYNNDGVLDEKWTYTDNRFSSAAMDRNLDGKIDVTNYYDRKGIINKSEMDDDFDGVFESVIIYKRGNAHIQNSDLNNDGITDYIVRFNNGVFHEVEILGPASNSPKIIQTYELNKLISSKFDTNGDGNFDNIQQYDYYEQIK